MMLSFDHDNDIYCAQTPVHTAAAPPCIPTWADTASPAPQHRAFLWSLPGIERPAAADRRSIFAAFVMFVAYAGILASGLTALSGFALLHQPEPVPPILKDLLLVNSLLLFWRLGVRAAFVASIYGPTEALMSIPRSLISNFISILSARRACFTYLHHIFGAPLSWDKTDHLVVPARSHGQN